MSQAERDRISKKYDIEKQKIKDTIAFGRHVQGPPQKFPLAFDDVDIFVENEGILYLHNSILIFFLFHKRNPVVN